PGWGMETCCRGRGLCAVRPALGPLRWVEQASMLQDRVAIGHAGDVVGDRAGAAGGAVRGLGLAGDVAVLGGHEVYVAEERLEELLEHPARFGGHPEHLVVPVDVLPEELHELHMLLASSVAQADEGLRLRTDIVYGPGLGLFDPGTGGADEVDYYVVD